MNIFKRPAPCKLPVSGRQLGTVVLGLTLAATTPTVCAFDGARPGFLLGVGLGAHSSDVEVSGDGFRSDGNSSGVALALKIGAGIGQRTAVYFLRDGQFDSSDVVFGLTGVGGTYHFRPSGPSAFLTAGLGLGDVTDDDFDTDSALGGAAMFGAGYDFGRGFQLDGSIMVVNATLDQDFGSDIDYDIVSGRVMVGYTWY